MVSVFVVNNPIFHQQGRVDGYRGSRFGDGQENRGEERIKMSRNFEARWGCLTFFVEIQIK